MCHVQPSPRARAPLGLLAVPVVRVRLAVGEELEVAQVLLPSLLKVKCVLVYCMYFFIALVLCLIR